MSLIEKKFPDVFVSFPGSEAIGQITWGKEPETLQGVTKYDLYVRYWKNKEHNEYVCDISRESLPSWAWRFEFRSEMNKAGLFRKRFLTTMAEDVSYAIERLEEIHSEKMGEDRQRKRNFDHAMGFITA